MFTTPYVYVTFAPRRSDRPGSRNLGSHEVDARRDRARVTAAVVASIRVLLPSSDSAKSASGSIVAVRTRSSGAPDRTSSVTVMVGIAAGRQVALAVEREARRCGDAAVEAICAGCANDADADGAGRHRDPDDRLVGRVGRGGAVVLGDDGVDELRFTVGRIRISVMPETARSKPEPLMFVVTLSVLFRSFASGSIGGEAVGSPGSTGTEAVFGIGAVAFVVDRHVDGDDRGFRRGPCRRPGRCM